MSFRNHQILRPPQPKCKKCGNEPAMAGRKDGLGKSCAHYAEESVRKAKAASKR